jgi:DNA-binding MarR family transcriptional regulator
MLHATLNIYRLLRDMDRDTILQQALDEITSHDPGKALRNARHWPGGRLSMIHLNVLFLLDSDGALPMRGLAEAMDVSQASATGIVDRMEQRGLVERVRDDEDRRVVRVAPTAQGRELVAGLAAQRRDHMARLLAELDDDELGAFLVGAQALRRARERWFATMRAESAHEPAPAGTQPSTDHDHHPATKEAPR